MYLDCHSGLGLYAHVGEVLHWQEHFGLNIGDLYPLQGPAENTVCLSRILHIAVSSFPDCVILLTETEDVSGG